jgi:hypothetical protein
MLIGQSAFQSVLTRLKEEEEENGAEPQPDAFRISGLASGFVADTADRPETSNGTTERAHAYFEATTDADPAPGESFDEILWPDPDTLSDDIDERPPEDDTIDHHGYITTAAAPSRASDRPRTDPPAPAHLIRISEDEIAEELAITGDDTEATLTERRRRFARANHPDSVAAPWRENATTRMKIANRMIDTAIARLRRR